VGLCQKHLPGKVRQQVCSAMSGAYAAAMHAQQGPWRQGSISSHIGWTPAHRNHGMATVPSKCLR
jgi:hypothetical protein